MGVLRNLLDSLIQVESAISMSKDDYLLKRNNYIDDCYASEGSHPLTEDEIESLKNIDAEFAESIEDAFNDFAGALLIACDKKNDATQRFLSGFDEESIAIKPSDWPYCFSEGTFVIDGVKDSIDYDLHLPRYSLVDAWYPGIEFVMNRLIDSLK